MACPAPSIYVFESGLALDLTSVESVSLCYGTSISICMKSGKQHELGDYGAQAGEKFQYLINQWKAAWAGHPKW